LCTGAGIDDSGHVEAVGALGEQKQFAEAVAVAEADEMSAESFLND
jgi:hypothetical protein